MIVLDTNVVVSGFLNPYGPPGQILQHVTEGAIALAYDARILHEYEQVLKRPEWRFTPSIVDDFLEQVQSEGLYVVGTPVRHALPDPSDAPFLEVALAVPVEALVTGNWKHFPPHLTHGIAVLSPADFLKKIQR